MVLPVNTKQTGKLMNIFNSVGVFEDIDRIKIKKHQGPLLAEQMANLWNKSPLKKKT